MCSLLCIRCHYFLCHNDYDCHEVHCHLGSTLLHDQIVLLYSICNILFSFDLISNLFTSPICSGPKRFDIIDGRWRYSHTGQALHDLLAKEFSERLGTKIDLSELPHSFIESDGDN